MTETKSTPHIVKDINNAFREFQCTHRRSPGTLYLGYEDYRELRSVTRHPMRSTSAEPDMYMGLRIYVVTNNNHIGLGT